jgi:hypothetical protein
MANEKDIKILKQGAKVWNRWREDNPEIEPNLSEIQLYEFNLEGANLTSTNFSDTLISRCNLTKALLNDAMMYCTTLDKVPLIEAELREVSFSYTNFNFGSLEKAILEYSTIVNAKFYGVDLKDTDFSHVRIFQSTFSNVDLSLSKGLETVMHVAPSTIDIDTLYNSAGKIPEIFLRECGIPDDFITFIPSHFGVQQAIQFYSCFISYSTKDEEFARRLYSRMRDEHLRVWFAPEDIKGGQKLYEQIEQAI